MRFIRNSLFGVLLFSFAFVGSTVFANQTAYSQDRCSDQDYNYVVGVGEDIKSIAKNFGSERFVKPIYKANVGGIINMDKLYQGQIIRIPYNVYHFNKTLDSEEAVLANPFCKTEQVTLDLESLSEEEKLEVFREAFGAIVDGQEKTDEVQEEIQQKGERQILTEIDGMIHDETRSKIGRDFYDIFYTYWQSPQDAINYSIRITEQPSPNLGTIVTVEVNHNQTFRLRLQPRYDFIEEAARYAVRTTRNHLASGQAQLQIY